MSVNLKQNADASLGLQGSDGDDGAFILEGINLVATSTVGGIPAFVVPRRMILKSASIRIEAAANAGTVTLKRATAAQAITAGTAIATAVSLTTAGPSVANFVLSATAANLDLAAGTVVGLDTTGGTLTGLNAVVSFVLAPA